MKRRAYDKEHKMGIFTSIGLAVGATAASAFAVGVGTTAIVAGAAVGYGMYSSDQQMKARKAAASAKEKAQMPKGPVKPEQKDSAKIAQAQATDKRRAMARNQSVKTSPLGLKDEAKIARKKVLGG